MNMGAERADAQPLGGETEWVTEGAWEAPAEADDFRIDEIEALPERSRWGARILAGLLILLALGWLGAGGYALSLAWPGPSLQAWIGWAATLSAPLILLGLVWLIFGRTARRETERFTEAVAAMRSESRQLESVLAAVAARLAGESRGPFGGSGAADDAGRRGLRPARPGDPISGAGDRRARPQGAGARRRGGGGADRHRRADGRSARAPKRRRARRPRQ